jgi:hypothetical protein
MKPPEQHRTREYGPHPVPRTARQFPGGPNVTGTSLAEEICRPLTAWAREEVAG